MAELPRIVWTLWLQGWQAAPRIVAACRRSWEWSNPDWEVRALDRQTLHQFIDDPSVLAAIDDPALQPEALSDRIRIALLAAHAGVWADATTYCLQPLDGWLLGMLDTGFFAFDRPRPDRMISSWFLAAKPGNYVVERWAALTREYWDGRMVRHDYFWFHHLFGDEYGRDPEFKRIYDQMPKMSADDPHYYVPQHERLLAAEDWRDYSILNGSVTPVLKLNHRLPTTPYPSNSVAELLCRRLGV